MFFEDIFADIFENDFWLPIVASITEDEERDFEKMSDEEIRSYYENDKLGKL